MSISDLNVGQNSNGTRNDNNDNEDTSMAGSQGSRSMMQVDLSIDGAVILEQHEDVPTGGGMMIHSSNGNACGISGMFDDAESDMAVED